MQTEATTNGKSHAKDAAGELVLQLPEKLVTITKTNYRKTFTGIEELAASIKEHGQISPIVVRRKGDAYELVVGERRLRAVRAGKLPTIAAIVRSMTDVQVLELQLVENCQRQDVHPLEEAEAYEALHSKHGFRVEDLAAKVGKSTAHIYQRMKLLALCPEARKAFYEEKIVASVAFLIARIPGVKQQKEAIKACTDYERSYGECVRIIQNKYMLRLADAPFDRADAKLVPAAGACTTCTKRTGNQSELFADVKAKDTCTDTACYRSKQDAHAAKVVEKAKARGAEVLPAAKAKQVFSHGYVSSTTGFVDLGDKDYQRKGAPTFKSLVGKDAPIVVAVDPDTGKAHELVKAADLKKALGGKGSKGAGKSDETKRREKQKRLRELLTLATAAVVAKAEAKELSTDAWRALVEGMIGFAWADVVKDVVTRRELGGGKSSKFDVEKTLKAYARKATPAQLRGLAAELVCTRGNQFEVGAATRGMLAAFKLDLKKLHAKQDTKQTGKQK